MRPDFDRNIIKHATPSTINDKSQYRHQEEKDLRKENEKRQFVKGL